MKRKATRRYRRSTKRRRFNVTKRKYPRRSRIGRKTAFLSVKRMCYLGTISPGTASTVGFWQYRTVTLNKGFLDQTGASMGGLSNVSEYQALFDQYRLRAFKIVLRPKNVSFNLDQTGTSTNFSIPYVTVSKDPYDTTSPTGVYSAATLNAFLETGKCKTYRGDRAVSIYMKPKVVEQYGSGATRYVTPKWTNLDTTGRDMEHRGFHLFFHNQGFATGLNSYDVFITYYLQFKGYR